MKPAPTSVVFWAWGFKLNNGGVTLTICTIELLTLSNIDDSTSSMSSTRSVPEIIDAELAEIESEPCKMDDSKMTMVIQTKLLNNTLRFNLPINHLGSVIKTMHYKHCKKCLIELYYKPAEKLTHHIVFFNQGDNSAVGDTHIRVCYSERFVHIRPNVFLRIQQAVSKALSKKVTLH